MNDETETATVIRETLTDGSQVWNVRYMGEGGPSSPHSADPEPFCITIGCTSRVAARALARALNAAAWVTVDS